MVGSDLVSERLGIKEGDAGSRSRGRPRRVGVRCARERERGKIGRERKRKRVSEEVVGNLFIGLVCLGFLFLLWGWLRRGEWKRM